MDKIFSTRIDENVIRQLDAYVKTLGISKKRLVEAALRAYFKQKDAKPAHEILERAFGAWSRTETVQETCARARSIFDKEVEPFSRHRPERCLARRRSGSPGRQDHHFKYFPLPHV